MAHKIVLDTNVLVSALRSSNGASFKLLSIIDIPKLELALSVPVVLEYEASTKKIGHYSGLSTSEIDAIINYLCKIGKHYRIYYLWRPLLKDPKDDMILELAVTSNSKSIITYNIRDFTESTKFGIKVITPKQLLLEIGEIS
jgi:putative PIN family toxin of toxin-antitoxin system